MKGNYTDLSLLERRPTPLLTPEPEFVGFSRSFNVFTDAISLPHTDDASFCTRFWLLFLSC